MVNLFFLVGVEVFVKQLFVYDGCYWSLTASNLPVTGLTDKNNEWLSFLAWKLGTKTHIDFGIYSSHY